MGRPVYATVSAALLISELAIALWVRDAWLRPYGGDVLAVPLVYALLRALSRLGARSALVYTLVIALAVELAQGARLLARLGLQGTWGLSVVLGSHFDLGDLVAYALGALLVLLTEALARVIRPHSAEKLPDLR